MKKKHTGLMYIIIFLIYTVWQIFYGNHTRTYQERKKKKKDRKIICGVIYTKDGVDTQAIITAIDTYRMVVEAYIELNRNCSV
jgi:transcription elongation factor Elf1